MALSERFSYRVRRRSSNAEFKVKPWHKFINWGNGAGTLAASINPYSVVSAAGNKLSTFRALEGKDGIRIPDFTTDRAVATAWIGDGAGVVCRTKLRGHSGDGIVLANTAEEMVAAPLYTKYIKKQDEYRVHVAFGEVIDIQAKRKRRDVPPDFATNYKVRNHHTGWVYCRENLNPPDGIGPMAVATVAALGLDFGAVDIIYNAKRNENYVLEVNTAPGLTGTTVTKYADAFARELTK